MSRSRSPHDFGLGASVPSAGVPAETALNLGAEAIRGLLDAILASGGAFPEAIATLQAGGIADDDLLPLVRVWLDGQTLTVDDRVGSVKEDLHGLVTRIMAELELQHAGVSDALVQRATLLDKDRAKATLAAFRVQGEPIRRWGAEEAKA
jgi:hypothetical protein